MDAFFKFPMSVEKECLEKKELEFVCSFFPDFLFIFSFGMSNAKQVTTALMKGLWRLQFQDQPCLLPPALLHSIAFSGKRKSWRPCLLNRYLMSRKKLTNGKKNLEGATPAIICIMVLMYIPSL